MWLIHRETDGHSGDRIPLPAPLREALVRWYVGEGSRQDEKAGITLVQNARIGHRWIACGCLGRDALPPILTPAFLSEADTYYLRRLTSTKRPEHRPDCPFFRDQVTNRITEARSPTTPADPPSGFFEVLRPAPERLAQRPEEDSNDDRTRHASTPRLARLLWRLMDSAGVNTVAPLNYGEEWSIREGFAAIGRAVGKIEMAPGIELARAFWTHARPLQAGVVYGTLRKLAPRWPRAHAPQGFVLLYAPSFQGHEIHVPDGEPVTIANRVQSPSVRGNRISGPFLILVVAGKYPEARGYAPLRAYAQPIYNGRLFVPVDSDFERRALRRILDCQRRLHPRGIDLAIGKPLFDTMTPDGPCRPDFVIEARSRVTGELRTVVVEAMGFATEEYEAAKAVTHPRMRHLGQLLTMDPAEVEGDDATGKLLAALDL
ncbi:hypothetical protein [Sphingomonas solaris]|uniref:DUF1173 domain-containing protein n=1 Tax=Alterirhizorhabdus solaris TaxID=2529389 RepID=A0A558RBZ3_9SPHN|nr:hypothetical protein [Sphingomonas solaris]TVV76945.1 hypothetical protein FOY91_02570 [Sphingomonas solaris]